MNGDPIDSLAPGAIAPVPVLVPADAFDNLVREWGVGFCCEWFGWQYDSEFSRETARVLQERTAAAIVRVGHS
jgi:hypothetical protein